MSLEHAPERQRATAGFGSGQRTLWRFKTLKAAGIVNSRMTLKRLIDSGRLAPGRLISPNVRAWTDEEIEALVANAPTARKPTPRSDNAMAGSELSGETKAESGASVSFGRAKREVAAS
jgi:hypothetical protein